MVANTAHHSDTTISSGHKVKDDEILWRRRQVWKKPKHHRMLLAGWQHHSRAVVNDRRHDVATTIHWLVRMRNTKPWRPT